MPKDAAPAADPAPEAAPAPAAPAEEHVHLDDFLHRLERQGKVEIAAAFARVSLAEGKVKQTLAAWEGDFEKFLHAKP